MRFPSSSPQLERSDLVALLGRTLGSAMAADVVKRAGAELGYNGPHLPLEAAYEVLEVLAASPGVVGTAASIARTELRVTAVRRSLERRSRL